MDRRAWLDHQRRIAEEQEDTIYAPILDVYWGAIDPLHEQFYIHFLSLCPPEGLILDAACGTGRFWPLILASGREVFGVDQSQGMLARAHAKFPQASYEKVGLQEMNYREAFDGASCMDAMESIPPEDWPIVLSNFHRAVKPGGYFYFTVETTSEEILQEAYADAQQAGLPTVYGEWAYEGGYHGDWAQAGGYHYYPKMGQVREWLEQAGFHLIDEAEGEEYHHFLVQKKHLIKPQIDPDSHR